MEKVISKDGTTIAVDRLGSGPALILIDGAMCSRGFGPMPPLAKELASRFTVYHYDRRGRGDSGNGFTYEVQREIDDLEAVLQLAGGSAMVFGISSGAALAGEAVRQLRGIRKARALRGAVRDRRHARAAAAEFHRRDQGARRRGRSQRRREEVHALRRHSGIVVFVMSLLPFWKKFTTIAHTLANDLEIIAPHHNGRPFPGDKWSSVTTPVLVMAGGKSPAYMQNSMRAWASAFPNAVHRTLAGQTHMVKQDVLAPALIEFFCPCVGTGCRQRIGSSTLNGSGHGTAD